MRQRWEQIRPALSAQARARTGHSKRFGTISWDTVCELKQLGRLVRECTLGDTARTLAIIVEVARERSPNEILRNICAEMLQELQKGK